MLSRCGEAEPGPPRRDDLVIGVEGHVGAPPGWRAGSRRRAASSRASSRARPSRSSWAGISPRRWVFGRRVGDRSRAVRAGGLSAAVPGPGREPRGAC